MFREKRILKSLAVSESPPTSLVCVCVCAENQYDEDDDEITPDLWQEACWIVIRCVVVYVTQSGFR